MLTCELKKLTGIDCPGCGIQRSFYKLLEGDIIESVKLFPALLPLFFLITYTLIHSKLMFKNGPKIILSLFIISTLLIVFNFTYKLVNL